MLQGPSKKKKYLSILNYIIILVVVYLYSFCSLDIFNLDYSGKDEVQNLINIILSYSGIIAGFLFTGLGLMLTLLDKRNIMRLYKNNYLDDLILSAKIGLIAATIDILFCLTVLFINNCLLDKEFMFFIMFLLSLLSTFNFAYASYRVFKLFAELKEN